MVHISCGGREVFAVVVGVAEGSGVVVGWRWWLCGLPERFVSGGEQVGCGLEGVWLATGESGRGGGETGSKLLQGSRLRSGQACIATPQVAEACCALHACIGAQEAVEERWPCNQ